MLFTATPYRADSQLHLRPYNLPLQNIVYNYQSAELSPLAMQSEDETPLRRSHYFLRAGYGNYQTPLVSARATIAGIPSTLLNARFNYLSSKGDLLHQNIRHLDGALAASYFLPTSELHASGGWKENDAYLYGFNQNLFKPEAKTIFHGFREGKAEIGYRNTVANQLGLNYHPVFQYRAFSLKDTLEESNLLATLPLDFQFNQDWKVQLDMSAEQTTTKQKRTGLSDSSAKNNLYSFRPFVTYRSRLYTAGAGLLMAQDNGKWIPMPVVDFSLPLKDSSLLLKAGIRSEIRQNTYRSLANENPYLLASVQNKNLRATTFFTGIHAFLGKYVQAHAEVSYSRMRNFAFFVNDTTATETAHLYQISIEDKLNIFRARLDMSYAFLDRLNLTAGIELNGYSGMTKNEKAWNVLPMEIHASAEYHFKKNWVFKGKLWMYSGSFYPLNGGQSTRFEGGNDLSLEARYIIRKNVSAFAGLNNIFGKTYQRWYRYPVYGIQALGGLEFRF